MFVGTIEAMSHEGGFLVTFSGSSPALDSIIIRSSDGVYIGKIDGVLGNTGDPIAHVGHTDRKLDLESLVGEEVTIRAKKPREERRDGGRRDDRRDSRGGDRSDRRDGGRRDDRRDGGGRFERRDSRGGDRNDSNSGDWDCNKCNNSNFAFRNECNRCGESRSQSGGRRDDRRDGGRRDDRRDSRGGDRSDRRDSRGGDRNDSNSGDWDCNKCNNSNFAFRNECNRCGESRSQSGGRRDGGRRDDRRDSRGGDRSDRRDSRGGDRNDRGSKPTYADNDWDCNKCSNSNFSFRNECNRCGEPRSQGGRSTGFSRDSNRAGGGERRSRENSRDGPRGNSRDGPRGNSRDGPRDSNLRRSKGKRPGHAHNSPPKPIVPRKFNRNRDD